MSRRAGGRGGDDPADDLRVTPPKSWAVDVPAVRSAPAYSLAQTSARRTALTLLSVNQADGIDCPGCAWPDPEHRHRNEYCENGAKHVNDEATTRRVTRAFFAEHPVAELDGRSDYWLNQQGRLSEPMIKRPGALALRPDLLGRSLRRHRRSAERAAVPRRGDVLPLGQGEQ